MLRPTLLFTSTFAPNCATTQTFRRLCSRHSILISPPFYYHHRSKSCKFHHRLRSFPFPNTSSSSPPSPRYRGTMSSATNEASGNTNTTIGTTAKTPSEHDVVTALESVRARISAALPTEESEVQLVAVSKTKPMPLLLAAYEAGGQRHFGENYVQELVSKAEELPGDIHWHFIGPLQTNKAKALVSIPNLYVVETVDREKAANALDKAVVSTERGTSLNVMVQVNTSGEESKSGCLPGETSTLVKHIMEKCSNLKVIGLMTIGAPDTSEEPEAFRILRQERNSVAKELGMEENDLKLSMGMSGDFEAAIKMGSNSVRVGSTIFGAREYPNKK